jgi:folate-binding protein YgfZ
MTSSVLNFPNTVHVISPHLTASVLERTQSMSEEYRLLTESAGLFEQNRAILSMTGKDCVDFLQRLSTNDVKSLSEGQTVTTILVTEKAKIVDIATVIRKNDELLLILQSNKAESVLKWLDKFLFTEDARIRDVTKEFNHFALVGEQAERLGNNFSEHVQDGFFFQDCLWGERMVHCLVRKNQTKDLRGEIFLSLITIRDDSDVLESYRIENGVTKFGYELTEQINPLEAGLERFISWTKGCYIGQEVIARIDTYKKLQRRLVGFVFDDERREKILQGKIYFQNEEVGWTTSHAWSEKLGKQIALGYLKTSVESDVVQFRNEKITEPNTVHVSKLPFDVQP